MEVIPLETVVSKIRERRELLHRPLLISTDNDEVATYQIEITTDSSVGSSLLPRFSLSGNEEYLAEYDFVQAEADEKEPRDSVIRYYEVMRKDNATDDTTKTDSVGVESAPVTERKKEFFVDPLARFSSSRCRKQTSGTIQAQTKKSSFDGVEVPVEPLARFSPFRKKKPSKTSVSSGSEHDGVVVAVAPVAPVTGFSPFRKKTRWNPKPAKSPGVSYFKASMEPEVQSTPSPSRKNKRSGSKLSTFSDSAVSASTFGSKRAGAKYLAASTKPVTESTQRKKPPSILSAFPFDPFELTTESTLVGENEDAKGSIQLDAKSTPVNTENDASHQFVVVENVDVNSKPVTEDKALASVDLENVSTPVKKSKRDDDTKSTTASSDSGLSPTKSPSASHIRRGTNQKTTEEMSRFERYLEKVLDKMAGSCNCRAPTTLKRIARKCDPVLEEEDEAMKLSVENILADKFQRSKRKAQERKAKKKADKMAEAKVEKPPIVEWGIKPSEDESDFSSVAKGFTLSDHLQKRVSGLITSATNQEDAGGKEMDGEDVGVFLRKQVSRCLRFDKKDGDAGEKEVDATVEDQEPSSAGDVVLSVPPVRMSKKKDVVEHLSDERGIGRNKVGPDDVSYDLTYDSLFDDIDSSGSNGDSECTNELVKVEFDPSKLWDRTDADKFLAREVLRRYAEMTGVSLEELIEEVVDESMASITLDTFPMER
jgi:hypothetical protein